ncbi:MAG: hypothetical protein B6D35_13195 [Candidatus Brocadia sp. UTAMX2]|jgi:hypothetical protein|nr:MAG: hypothetical protein B6D35_13195 [Candidatus Brocadia sp. UTAMX2]
MRSDRIGHAYIKDARTIAEEAKESLNKKHYHRTVRKCQESVELAWCEDGVFFTRQCRKRGLNFQSFSGDRFEDRRRIVPLRRNIDNRIEPLPFRPEDFYDGGMLAE